jgi:two-component system NtrC family sensor kinase
LLVEDQDMVRALCARAIRGAGFAVLETPTAGGALALLRTPGVVDLVVIDSFLPGTGTHPFVEELARDQPHVRVLEIGGDPWTLAAATAAGRAVLAKPFYPDTLAAMVRGILGSGPGLLPASSVRRALTAHRARSRHDPERASNR